MDKSVKIAVVGAGIGGLASAIYLAHQGHSVSIFEKFSVAKPIGSGLLLQPPGQEVLRELGLLGDIKNKGAVINALNSQNYKGKTILDLKYSDLDGPSQVGLSVGRALLHDTLLQKAIECGVTLVLGAEISKIDQVTGQLASSQTTYDCFDIIIIAGGPRDILIDDYPKRKKNQYNWSCLWANVTLPDDCPKDQLGQRCKSSNHMIGLLPSSYEDNGITIAAFFWSLRSRRLADWRAQPYENFVEQVSCIWPSAAKAIASLDHADFCHAIYYDITCDKPWNGNIIAIGDSIHGTSPQLGQGATMALLDAKILAESLATHTTMEQAFSHFWHLRKKQIRFVHWASKFITPFFQSRSSIAGSLRDLTCHKITQSDFGKRLALETLASRRDSLF